MQQALVARGRVDAGSISMGLANPGRVEPLASSVGCISMATRVSRVVSQRAPQQAALDCRVEDDTSEQDGWDWGRVTEATRRLGGCSRGVAVAVWDRTAYEGGVIPRSKAQASRSAGDLQQQLVQHFTGELQPQCPPWQGYGVSSSGVLSPEALGDG